MMKKSIQALLFIAFALTLSWSVQAQKDITEEIQEINHQFMNAYNSGNAAGVAALYTSDAILYPPNSDVVKGTDAIQTMWEESIKAGISKIKLTTVEALSYGKVALEDGRVELYAGDEFVGKEKFIVVWRKVKGQWKLHQDMWNSMQPLK
jgi:uncharacterized protein (TIGR02246 family)